MNKYIFFGLSAILGAMLCFVGNAGEVWAELSIITGDTIPPLISRETQESQETFQLYFPHIACTAPWDTEITVVNTSKLAGFQGTLRGFKDNGEEILPGVPLSLERSGQKQIAVRGIFSSGSDIGYAILESASSTAIGSVKFYRDGVVSVTLPAVRYMSSGDICLPHIASNESWWTGFSLLNTTPARKSLTFEFNNGVTKSVALEANEHRGFTLESLFDGQAQSAITSGTIKYASGIIGVELFGTESELSGMVLSGDSRNVIYFPYVTSQTSSWTGFVIYNPSVSPVGVTLKAYSADGVPLGQQVLLLNGKERYVRRCSEVPLPPGTAWLSAYSTGKILGFELFGSTDGRRLAECNVSGSLFCREGIFPNIGHDDLKKLLLLNAGPIALEVRISGYNDTGVELVTATVLMNAYCNLFDTCENLFRGQDVGHVTFVAFTANRNLIPLQITESADGQTLDCLQGLSGSLSDAPLISDVRAECETTDSAILRWHTDDYADSAVEIGTTSSLGMLVYDDESVKDHYVFIGGLEKGKVYQYRLRSGAVLSAGHTFSTCASVRDIGPVLTISFDDGYETDYQVAMPLMRARSMRGLCNVVAGYVGERSMMSVTQLRELQEKGWEIGSHSVTHPDGGLVTLPLSDAEAEIRDSKTWLEAEGVGPVKIFCYPDGKVSSVLDAFAGEIYFLRFGVDAVRPDWTNFWTLPLSSQLREIPGWGMNLNELKAFVDMASARGKYALLGFHKLTASGDQANTVTFSLQNFEALLDYIQQKGYKVVPPSELTAIVDQNP